MTDAERLFLTGGAHARAAHALIGASQSNVHMTLPFYLLLAFSTELTLKAAYVYLGGNAHIAEKDIRHDLLKALAYAKEVGFEPDNSQLQWLTETMADVHRKNEFRYLSAEGELRVADEAHGLRILDDLVAQVGQLLYPEHDRSHWIDLLATFDPRSAEKS
jgi:hypothetical protein